MNARGWAIPDQGVVSDTALRDCTPSDHPGDDTLRVDVREGISDHLVELDAGLGDQLIRPGDMNLEPERCGVLGKGPGRYYLERGTGPLGLTGRLLQGADRGL
jgi:hypothetical protein